ncbi:pyruvate dehydrogenase (acetyl-transferring) E1 component subunit alpha [Actinocrinis puniceicyclus]|uniref:2-oxoisovalerate dehydrogenase subunit alpha n=1 Tax=Actinocrinis puniceicyclus TaxID=977794 RepID=A0A8J7WR12_9ACTN|nr:thiamine pyrophosphate-dependent enzyme [Actinocrinis puniceicyclus]MBS2963859.1 pyruvate dehydrogenase (acetyl-transferring) E1 component subunit alpha [Actinocrinis puniceicyclus]
MTLLDLPLAATRGNPAAAASYWDTDPLRYLDEHGAPVEGGLRPAPEMLAADRLLAVYRSLRLARAFDTEATALVMQGHLAVYPSSRGQEACQAAAALCLQPQDWLFPTYRDTAALAVRGIDPVEALTLLRGSWHCGYDPKRWRTAPQCTPLATQAPHAVGLALAAKMAGDPVVALCLLGDGATSEGDFHEACNSAGVYQAPVVFLVQNNQYAISVPLRKQTRALSLAGKGAGYGMPGVRVDGNDVIALMHVLDEALERARAGGGPTLIEAVTYRIRPHTNADDAARYRDQGEVELWLSRDPVDRLARYLTATGRLDAGLDAAIGEEGAKYAAAMRERLAEEPHVDPGDMFEHVFAGPTPQLRAQRAMVEAEIAAQSADSSAPTHGEA